MSVIIRHRPGAPPRRAASPSSWTGESVAVLSLDAIERLRPRGRPLGGRPGGARSRSEAARLQGYDRALNMLAFRARSSRELARSLVRKGEEKAHVDWAIERLQEQGLARRCRVRASRSPAPRSWAASSRGAASSRIWRGRACRATVERARSTTVFEEEGVDQRAIVEEAARKKLRSLAGLEPAVQRRRLYAIPRAPRLRPGRHP